MSDFGIIIQARTGSSRLPGKVLLPFIDNKTVIQYIWARAISSGVRASIILATPYTDSRKFAGMSVSAPNVDENDVLSRYYITARNCGFKYICRITSDCPLVDFSQADKYLTLVENGYDYASNSYPTRTAPSGLDVEVFSYDVLKEAYFNAILSEEREHVTPFMHRHFRTFKSYLSLAPNIKLSIDTKSDYERVKFLGQKLHNWSPDDSYNSNEVLDMYNKYVLEINAIGERHDS